MGVRQFSAPGNSSLPPEDFIHFYSWSSEIKSGLMFVATAVWTLEGVDHGGSGDGEGGGDETISRIHSKDPKAYHALHRLLC